MPPRLVALDEGPDIMLDRGMVVVGRHPGCDARLESPRVSRHHCCVMPDNDEVVVRDLGSTNGIRINGQRVETGRLKSGDEFSIAHVRYRLEHGEAPRQPPADWLSGARFPNGGVDGLQASTDEDVLAAAVRKVLPEAVASKCRIQVIVQMIEDSARVETSPSPPPSATSPTPVVENQAECP